MSDSWENLRPLRLLFELSRADVRLLELDDPPVRVTAYAVTRLGREQWAPLRLLLDRLAVSAGR